MWDRKGRVSYVIESIIAMTNRVTIFRGSCENSHRFYLNIFCPGKREKKNLPTNSSLSMVNAWPKCYWHPCACIRMADKVLSGISPVLQVHDRKQKYRKPLKQCTIELIHKHLFSLTITERKRWTHITWGGTIPRDHQRCKAKLPSKLWVISTSFYSGKFKLHID